MFNEDAAVPMLSEADAQLPTTKAEAAERHGRIVSHARALHAALEAGQKRESEKSEQIERMAVEMRSLTQKVAELNAADPFASAGGTDAELRRFVDNDGRLFLRGFDADAGPEMRRSDNAGLLDSRPVNDAHRNLQEACEALYVATTIKCGRDGFSHAQDAYRTAEVRKRLPVSWHRVQRAWSAMPAAVRKAFDGGTGTGDEFIPLPTLASPMWQVAEYDPEGILQLFPRITINTESVKLPVGTLYPVPYKGGGASGDNPAALAKSSVGTDDITLTAADMYVMVLIYENAAEDSIVSAFPFIRSAIARSLAIGTRFAILNGDTAGTHQDDIANWDLRGIFGAVDAGSIDYRRVFLGLRANALDNSNGVDRSTFNLAALASDINLVGGPRGVPGDSPILTSYEGYLANFVNLPGIVSANDYGNRQPIAAGEVGTIFGHPIIPTDAMSCRMNATGLYDNVTKDKTGYVAFNRTMHPIIERAGTTIALQNDITVGGSYMRAKQRLGFKDLTKSADAGVRYAFNMSK